jgi:hypothetical protein
LARHQPEEIRTRQHRLLEQCFAQHPRHAVSVGEVGSGHWGSRRNDPIKPLVACGRCDERPRPHFHRRLRGLIRCRTRPRRSKHSLKFLFPLARQWVVERRSLERAARGEIAGWGLVPT